MCTPSTQVKCYMMLATACRTNSCSTCSSSGLWIDANANRRGNVCFQPWHLFLGIAHLRRCATACTGPARVQVGTQQCNQGLYNAVRLFEQKCCLCTKSKPLTFDRPTIAVIAGQAVIGLQSMSRHSWQKHDSPCLRRSNSSEQCSPVKAEHVAPRGKVGHMLRTLEQGTDLFALTAHMSAPASSQITTGSLLAFQA